MVGSERKLDRIRTGRTVELGVSDANKIAFRLQRMKSRLDNIHDNKRGNVMTDEEVKKLLSDTHRAKDNFNKSVDILFENSVVIEDG